MHEVWKWSSGIISLAIYVYYIIYIYIHILYILHSSSTTTTTPSVVFFPASSPAPGCVPRCRAPWPRDAAPVRRSRRVPWPHRRSYLRERRGSTGTTTGMALGAVVDLKTWNDLEKTGGCLGKRWRHDGILCWFFTMEQPVKNHQPTEILRISEDFMEIHGGFITFIPTTCPLRRLGTRRLLMGKASGTCRGSAV